MKSLFAFLVVLPALVACSSQPSVHGAGPPNRTTFGDAGAERKPYDIPEPDVPDGGADCEPSSCEKLAFDCGLAADGCGELLDCGSCVTGEFCGVLKHNECAAARELCLPISSGDACQDRQCGMAGDGCGGAVDCGTCDADETCGLKVAFQCEPTPVLSAKECPGAILQCGDVGAECGLIGNGCGETLDCDAEIGCSEGEVCGASVASRCDPLPICVPLRAEEICGEQCGIVSNGCGASVDGGLLDCATAGGVCGGGESCGGGGVLNECGQGECSALSGTEACENVACGIVTDGCDGSYSCGTCAPDALCRDGACLPMCTPSVLTLACEGKECGLVGDGCGGTHDCGSCSAGESCGQFAAFACGPTPEPECVPLSLEQACAGKECGILFDGCGIEPDNIIDCGASGGCGTDEVCGTIDGFQCDVPGPASCTAAASCAELGWECGTAVDDCGNAFDCAAEGLSCDLALETCIGGVMSPARCLTAFETDQQGDCEVCGAIPNCFGEPQITKVSGRVVTPGRSDGDVSNQIGVPNAFVYILQTTDESDLPPISAGIPQAGGVDGGLGDYQQACDRCDTQDLGPVLVSTTTDSLGAFTLQGSIPVDEEFLLVVKTGKWRRAERVTLPPSSACSTVQLANIQTRLPRNQKDGAGANLPKIAVSTGRVDAMECVFYKLGVDASEFEQPGSDGSNDERIHLYRADVSGGASAASAGITSHSELYLEKERLFGYDMLVFDCQSSAVEHNAADPNIREFVNRGGRLFASHWSYTWLHDNGALSYDEAVAGSSPMDTGIATSANWVVGAGTQSADTGYISVGRPGANQLKTADFAEWSLNEGASALSATGRYSMNIVDPRDLAESVGQSSEEFVYRFLDDPASGAADYCQPCSQLVQSNCVANDSCQWAGAACVAVNDCTLKTTAACVADSQCNWEGSACEYKLNCDEGDVDNNDLTACLARAQCGWGATTVQQFSFNTPYGAPDAKICGRVAYSGFHVTAENGTDYTDAVFPGHCSGDLSSQEKVLLYMLFDLGACISDAAPEPPACTPIDQVAACSARCGIIADGCGGLLDCSSCGGGLACHPGGICGPAGCVPTSCAAQGATCGTIADGCAETLDCGACEQGQVCGLLTPNQCKPTCTPLSNEAACSADSCGFISNGCDDVAACGGCDDGFACVNSSCSPQTCEPLTACPSELTCGTMSDGCDGMLHCGEGCALPDVCGGGGIENQCGKSSCEPLTCDDFGASCGFIGDGCGGSLQCGDCAEGSACGAYDASQCGGCTPLSCADVAAECGAVGDGCGGVVECGQCADGLFCGADTANSCGVEPTCQRLSCDDLKAECGVIGDGCGGIVTCDECDIDEVCGAEEAFKCADAPECVPQTCDDADAECGAIGDGCGGLVECGPCGPGATCGAVHANRCPPVIKDPF